MIRGAVDDCGEGDRAACRIILGHEYPALLIRRLGLQRIDQRVIGLYGESAFSGDVDVAIGVQSWRADERHRAPPAGVRHGICAHPPSPYQLAPLWADFCQEPDALTIG